MSDKPGLKTFTPLPASNPDAGVEGLAVWAIDESHLVNYLLPRDCPRVTFAPGKTTTNEDMQEFFKNAPRAKRVIIVEEAWLERIKNCTLFVYRFRPENFEPVDLGAGYYISRRTETPVGCVQYDDVLAEIEYRGSTFQTLHNLWETIDKVSNSTLEFSIIRKRNALPRNPSRVQS